MNVLGIESSCDETGVAIVHTELGLRAHALHSQIKMHQEYGGVVPELASRDHIRRMLPLIQQCLDEATITMDEIDYVAYTAGPGLAGALLVGGSVANALAWSLQKPIIPIHHLEGHLLSPLMSEPIPVFPFVALLVSGGHTQLMKVGGVNDYVLLGETLDDAAGEAFDKTAKLLGLPYPGGPALAALAEKGRPDAIQLPRPMLHSKDLDFSFSGLKTAVLTRLRAAEADGELTEQYRADCAAATEQAIVDVLIAKTIAATQQAGVERLVIAGGVGANKKLRQQLKEAALQKGLSVYYPPIELCTDNGAMIAYAAAMRLKHGLVAQDNTNYGFSVRARWPLNELTGPVA